MADWRSPASATGPGLDDYINAEIAAQRVTGPLGTPLALPPGDKAGMFNARAQAFMNGEFTTYILDAFGANTDVGSIGFGGAPAATMTQVTSGRCGGSQWNVAGSGTAFHNLYPVIQGIGSMACNVADMIWDPWYLEAGVKVIAITGSGELGFCGLQSLTLPWAGAADGTSIYMSLGISGSVSLTNLTVRAYSGTALVTQVTTIPVELNTYRRYFLAHDGMSTVYWGRDGVVFGQRTMFDQQPSTPCAMFNYERALSGTYSCNNDYFGCAMVAP